MDIDPRIFELRRRANRTQKKKINTKLIKFQNKMGKQIGKQAWIDWKFANGHS